jgi:hypothetical protein
MRECYARILIDKIPPARHTCNDNDDEDDDDDSDV